MIRQTFSPSAMPLTSNYLLILVSVLSSFAGLVFVFFLLSQLGWRSFADRLPARARPPGTPHTVRTVWFRSRFVRYNNAVRVIFSPAGLYLYHWLPLLPFHPPVLIPWPSLRSIEKKETRFATTYTLNILDPAGEMHLLLSPKAEPDLFKFAKPELLENLDHSVHK